MKALLAIAALGPLLSRVATADFMPKPHFSLGLGACKPDTDRT